MIKSLPAERRWIASVRAPKLQEAQELANESLGIRCYKEILPDEFDIRKQRWAAPCNILVEATDTEETITRQILQRLTLRLQTYEQTRERGNPPQFGKSLAQSRRSHVPAEFL